MMLTAPRITELLVQMAQFSAYQHVSTTGTTMTVEELRQLLLSKLQEVGAVYSPYHRPATNEPWKIVR